jgi:hypothetical protein
VVVGGRVQTRTILGIVVPALASFLSGACRSDKAPEPAPAPVAATATTDPPALPTQSARFVWHPPLSVPVVEKVESSGPRLELRYWLDVCPGKGGTLLVSHRGLKVAAVDDVPASDPGLAQVAERAEAAAAALPTMVVDRSGAFVDATGFREMMDRLTASYPRQDFSSLKQLLASGDAAVVFKPALASRWQTWIDLWLRFDPTRGRSQEIASDDAPGGSTTLISYKGLTAEHRVRLAATRVFSEDEVRQLARLGGTDLAAGNGIASPPQAEVLSEVETDWPDVRPWWAHTRKTMRGAAGGKEIRIVEDRQYRFDWHTPVLGQPSCP